MIMLMLILMLMLLIKMMVMMDKEGSLNLDMVDGLWLYWDTQSQDEFIKTISD